MQKYKIYTIIAIIIMSVCFTIPALGFFGVSQKIANGEAVPTYAVKIWNLYSKIQYKNHLIDKDTASDLNKMIASRAEIAPASFPVWSISLDAPNYPKEAFPNGVPLYVHIDGYGGDVSEMNTLNHYIGMYAVEHGGNFERAMSPYYLLISTLCMLAFLYYDGRANSLLMVLPIIAPLIFIACYAGWLYWYGHNMQEFGAFKIKPFMPTAFGDGKVAQFNTHSYPAIGFYAMLLLSFFSILALFSKRKFLADKR
ncbi:cytochrome C [Campylobacter geochelonis]|uniref:cytochrome C n=1 Tax=Campylobacter geochelonis TaxID=1780362 RepID=UPI0007708AE5|nr:cytochrome C [Campylobacter geochelonis]CZE46030.1 Uncharacterised protein [Campylobacter geochelonis]CZE49750.1 Uncharacterised protein [Campylobacter geochelonis]